MSVQLKGNSSVKQDLVHLKEYGTTIQMAYSSVVEPRLFLLGISGMGGVILMQSTTY